MAYNKNNLYKTLHLWSRDTFNFDFSEKGLENVFPLHFVYDFSRKMFLMLYSIDWLYFLRYWSVCALQLFVITSHNHMTKGAWWIGKWESLNLSHHHQCLTLIVLCGTGDMFLLCHVTSHDHMIKGAPNLVKDTASN